MVGAGPVGLAVAALLGRSGLDVVVLEPRRELVPRDEPKPDLAPLPAAMPVAATLRTSTRAIRRADSALALSRASALTPNIAPYCPALSPIIDW